MSKVLVAYFSASGTTKRLAENIAEVTAADLHEIVPLKPYTEDDLNWNNMRSRSSVEMNDETSRPEIAGKVNIDKYDVILLGFPIWWYKAPKIINTFLEQYKLEGKTIVPFATSGGSGMGATNDDLVNSCKGAILKQGKRFVFGTPLEELRAWADSVM